MSADIVYNLRGCACIDAAKFCNAHRMTPAERAVIEAALAHSPHALGTDLMDALRALRAERAPKYAPNYVPRYVLSHVDMIRDMHSGFTLSIQEILDALNAAEAKK